MFRYSAFIVFLLCFYSGLTAGDKTDDDFAFEAGQDDSAA